MSKNQFIGFVILIIIILIASVLFAVHANKQNNQDNALIDEQKNNTAQPTSQKKKGNDGRHYVQFPGELPEQELMNKQARITTEKGDIVFTFFGHEAPKAVSNFIILTNDGYYDGINFHRREEGFVIQGGDPNGNGTGGPGYTFEDEPVQRPYARGTVAMANAGPHTNGSQFFIMLSDYSLPPAYTIFGFVTEGMDVVDQINVGDVMIKVVIENMTQE